MIAIGVFLLLATSSFGPDASTNTSVAIKDCKEQAPILGKLKVTINIDDTSYNYTGRLIMSHQKVRPDTCDYDIVWNVNQEILIARGTKIYVYDGPEWIHDNSEDLFRVQIHMYSNGKLLEKTDVQKYNTSHFTYTVKRKPPLTFNSIDNCDLNTTL